MASKAKREGPVAAYIPFKSLNTATEVLEQGLPRKLDRSAFPTFSGSMKSWVISAFEFLGFIDEAGNVLPLLDRWVEEPDARKGIMREILTNRYTDLVSLVTANGTSQQFHAEVQNLGVSGTTAQRASRFFIAASEYAGISLPPTWKQARIAFKTNARNKRGETQNGATVDPDFIDSDDEDDGEANKHRGSRRTVDLRSGGAISLSVSVDLMDLSHEDRDFVFSMIDKLREYEPKRLTSGADRSEEPSTAQ